MKIVSIGGGPAGLYFGILMKRAFPETEIRILERNRPDDTYGWGVVFSDETLENFEAADAVSYAEITRHFKHWTDIETYRHGECTVSTGHGFSALSRKKLLAILHRRCLDLGVEIEFEREVASLDEFRDADLILAADGANSWVRRQLADQFRPRIDWRRCKFTWLGTDKPLSAFTFIFEPSEHGLFQVHAYPFEEGLSTWIVECREETWQAAGLAAATEAETVAFCEELFAEHLDGYRLLNNRSIWRSFPTVQCETWHHGNVVLLGDAAHTAHFSVGSGTKLAMEDAVTLVEAFQQRPGGSIAEILEAYENARWVEVVKLQKAAQTSLEWFENSARFEDQESVQFTFNLMTRSKRITYDNLAERDPELVRRINAWYCRDRGVEVPAGAEPPPPAFTPFRLGDLELANRIVVSPMCQYSARDGLIDDWHLVHLGSRAIGGAGLIITEMTDVTPEGRITPGCAGLWNDDHTAAWKRVVDFVHGHSGTKIGIQLAHAGRKGSVHHPWQGEDIPLTAAEGAWQTLAPSALPYYPHWPVPKAMDRADMERITAAFVAAAERALEAGFDLLELHMAHGYLLSSFLSPLSNQRRDEYGGSLENRIRYPLEVLRAVRAVWPKVLAVRVSASDWMDDGSGTTPDETVAIARRLSAAGCDILDVSSAGNSPESLPEYGRMYQVPFAEKARFETDLPVMAVGALQGADHANTVLAAGRADLALMARPHLHNPYLTLHAAEHYELWDHPWPGQYVLGRATPPRASRRRKLRPLSPMGPRRESLPEEEASKAPLVAEPIAE
ncbi:MAG: bifunctional salicylyl-CoA 5-hydroxylase/oxidoreductase [Acidobacteriota bacterium]